MRSSTLSAFAIPILQVIYLYSGPLQISDTIGQSRIDLLIVSKAAFYLGRLNLISTLHKKKFCDRKPTQQP